MGRGFSHRDRTGRGPTSRAYTSPQMAFLGPFLAGPDPDDTNSDSSDLISLDLSGAHTEAAALASDPMLVLAHRFHPPEENDLTSLNLDCEP
jgi:hypothetical protein